jgi:hypothetical protein
MSPMALGSLIQACVGALVLTGFCIAITIYHDNDDDVPEWFNVAIKSVLVFTALSFIAMGWFLALRY